MSSILTDLNEEIQISISPLNDEDPNKIIIICSTTGNADIPDNALKFWTKIKSHSVFCDTAKKISKRLKELSATELEPLVTIDDEVNNYEEKIDIFIELIKKHFL